MKRLGCILCMPHKWTRDSKYSCRRTKIKIFAPPVAWFSLSAKLFSPLSSLPVNSTPHEIVFRALLPYVIGWLNCVKIYLLQQRKFSTRDVNGSRSCSLLFLGFLNEKLFENATLGLSDVFLDHRSIIDPWSSNPTLLGTFTFDFSIPIIPYGLDLIHDCCLLLFF